MMWIRNFATVRRVRTLTLGLSCSLTALSLASCAASKPMANPCTGSLPTLTSNPSVTAAPSQALVGLAGCEMIGQEGLNILHDVFLFETGEVSASNTIVKLAPVFVMASNACLPFLSTTGSTTPRLKACADTGH
jgi:hypothetical protein